MTKKTENERKKSMGELLTVNYKHSKFYRGGSGGGCMGESLEREL